MTSQQTALFLESRLGQFVLGTRDIPIPGAGDLLVEVHATALNPVDRKIQADGPAFIQEYPAILGTDCAGVIKEIGEGVTGFVVGDKVYSSSITLRLDG